jgi:hypothetical protein
VPGAMVRLVASLAAKRLTLLAEEVAAEVIPGPARRRTSGPSFSVRQSVDLDPDQSASSTFDLPFGHFHATHSHNGTAATATHRR